MIVSFIPEDQKKQNHAARIRREAPMPEMRKIVIGYLGDHLESAASRYVKKR